MSEQPLSEITDEQEKRWAIDSAARTLREMGRISKDEELMKAAQAELDKEQQEAQAGKTLANALSGQSPAMQTTNEA